MFLPICIAIEHPFGRLILSATNGNPEFDFDQLCSHFHSVCGACLNGVACAKNPARVQHTIYGSVREIALRDDFAIRVQRKRADVLGTQINQFGGYTFVDDTPVGSGDTNRTLSVSAYTHKHIRLRVHSELQSLNTQISLTHSRRLHTRHVPKIIRQGDWRVCVQ